MLPAMLLNENTKFFEEVSSTGQQVAGTKELVGSRVLYNVLFIIPDRKEGSLREVL